MKKMYCKGVYMKKNIKGLFGLIIVLLILSGCLSTGEKMYFAANGRDLNGVQKLVRKGANVDGLYSSGGLVMNGRSFHFTPLLLAARNGDMNMLRYLVQNGANVNRTGFPEQFTPLQLASFNGHFEVVRFLVERGADINLRNTTGATALSYAYGRGHLQIYNYLKDLGAIEFAPTQATQQPTSSPVQTAPTTQQANVAQQLQEAFRSPLENGTYTLSGTRDTLRLNAIASSGTLTMVRDGRSIIGSYSISGNIMRIQMHGNTYVYTVTSRTTFTGHGETWIRTGL